MSTTQQKAAAAFRILRALYARRMPAPVLRRAERMHHKLACAAWVERQIAAKAGSNA